MVRNKKMNKTLIVNEFLKFLETIEILRSENGCPWDKVQTPESMRGALIEEAIEASSAISEKNPCHAKEELGDLFLNTLMISYMYEQNNDFSVDSVISSLTEKLIRRHPHVFKESEGASEMKGKVSSSTQVLEQWNKIKDNVEARKKNHILDEVPENFPLLLRAYKLQKKASKKGFDWKETDCVIQKILEELNEVKEVEKIKRDAFSDALKKFPEDDKTVEPFTLYSTEALDEAQKNLEDEVGDLLFSVVNYSRHLGVNPEVALDKANRKFKKRFDYVETQMEENNIPWDDEHIDEREKFWEAAKKNAR